MPARPSDLPLLRRAADIARYDALTAKPGSRQHILAEVILAVIETEIEELQAAIPIQQPTVQCSTVTR